MLVRNFLFCGLSQTFFERLECRLTCRLEQPLDVGNNFLQKHITSIDLTLKKKIVVFKTDHKLEDASFEKLKELVENFLPIPIFVFRPFKEAIKQIDLIVSVILWLIAGWNRSFYVSIFLFDFVFLFLVLEASLEDPHNLSVNLVNLRLQVTDLLKERLAKDLVHYPLVLWNDWSANKSFSLVMLLKHLVRHQLAKLRQFSPLSLCLLVLFQLIQFGLRATRVLCFTLFSVIVVRLFVFLLLFNLFLELLPLLIELFLSQLSGLFLHIHELFEVFSAAALIAFFWGAKLVAHHIGVRLDKLLGVLAQELVRHTLLHVDVHLLPGHLRAHHHRLHQRVVNGLADHPFGQLQVFSVTHVRRQKVLEDTVGA